MEEQEKAVERKNSAVEKLFRNANKAEKFAARRGRPGTKSRVVIETNVRTRKKPQAFRQNIEYDFLQYTRIVNRWALANHDLSRGELELLHYLNPIGVFGQKDFDFFYKTIGLYNKKAMQSLMDRGWIVLWRPGKRGKERALYTLSNKGKNLCSRMHKMCLGEENIPETRNNEMVRDKTKAINKYFMDIVKSMNKRKAST